VNYGRELMKMNKKTVRDVDAGGKRVLVRVDFNVPMQDGQITDDTRIRAVLPTTNYLREAGALVILCAHLGRPKGQIVPEHSLAPVAARLSELLDDEAAFVDDCLGKQVTEAVEAAQPGDVILLENTRFYPGETSKDKQEMLAFAEKLAAPAQMYVNDAFGASHRKHGSTFGVTKFLSPCVAGLLVEEELTKLQRIVDAEQDGFVTVLGGAKVEDKIGVVKQLLPRVENLLIGGAMAWAFFKAQGMEVGESLCSDESVAGARDILATMSDCLDNMALPVDVHMKNVKTGETRYAPADGIEPGWDALDIGPQTREKYAEIVRSAQVVFWNGPMGYFEQPPFDDGTLAVARAMGQCPGYNVVGGGDSVAAITQMGLADEMDHVSTGGGASLEFIENNGSLPAVAALDDK